MVFLNVTRGRVVTSNRYYVCCMAYVYDLPKVFLALLETEDRERVAAWSSLEALLILWLRSIISGCVSLHSVYSSQRQNSSTGQHRQTRKGRENLQQREITKNYNMKF